LTLERLRSLGFVAGVVERFIPHVNRKKDFLGCIDLIAVHPIRPGVLAIQATTAAHVGDRLKKAKGRAELRAWLACGAAFQVWGWFQRAGRWDAKIVAVTGADLTDIVVMAPARRGRRPRQAGLFDSMDPQAFATTAKPE
jgi:hypothetical protein